MKHYKILMGILSANPASGTPVDVTKLFMDLFFDIISDLTLGESFDTLTTGQRNPIIGEFLAHQQSVGFVILNMWIFHLMRSIPNVSARIVYWMRWYATSIAKRREVRERSSYKRRWYAGALKNRGQVRYHSSDKHG